MSDLIDRQDVLNILREESTFYGITERILKLRSIPQWIPCEERLPERYWDVLVTVKEKYKDEEQYRYHADVAEHFEGDEWCTNNDWDEGQEVEIVAWMPLPEPWKGEE